MAGAQRVPQGVPCGEITEQLIAWNAGDSRAASPAFAALYGTLRRLASRALVAERIDHTLGTAGLISEVFFRMLEQRVEWRSREHFIGTAAQMMRRVLVDHARGRRARKRGGGVPGLPVLENALVDIQSRSELLAIHDALDTLAAIDRVQSQIVELRFFGGMTHDEIASYLGVSLTTVERRWRLARAWLYRRLAGALP